MSKQSSEAKEHECDVLVVGSGASGLATAVVAAHHGLRVVVVEKETVLGGTTAWSGGWLWVPRNPLAREAGIVESEAEPRLYLQSELGDAAHGDRVGAFLHNGPKMVQFFRDHTAVEWIDGNRIPDFHVQPGAAKGGRSVCAAPFDGRLLGAWLYRLRPPLDLISLKGMGIASGADLAHFQGASRSLKSALYVLRRLLRHLRDLVVYRRSTQLVNGNALVARLLRSALDLNVDIRVGTQIRSLVQDKGRVAGASLADGIIIRARRGVVLACGGFPHDRNRMAKMFSHAPTGREHHSAAPSSNTGDGLAFGESVGGVVSQSMASPGAWSPVSLVQRADGSVGRFPHLIERAKPGVMAVGPDGRRFVNEADSYHDFMSALFASYPDMRTPHAWLIADHRAQRRYGLGYAKPFPFSLESLVRSGYLKRGRTLAELAAECHLPEAVLQATVDRFNQSAVAGEDLEFGRGSSPYNRIQGDAANTPNPSLGALTRGPYYAVKIVPGSLGTFSGLETDHLARVLDVGKRPIEGLFAVGNDMNSIMGGHYPSGGITLGPGMTFGYIAGRVLAGEHVEITDPAATERTNDLEKSA